MKNRIISFILVLSTLLSTFAFAVNAASGEEFLSDVALVYEDSVEDAKKSIEGTDWKLFEQDLNPDADFIFDDGVYLIYKTSTNVEDAITDLRVMDMYGGYSTSNYEKQLEKTRNQYMQAVADLRKATAEFKALYEAGDEMAKLAYRQMNYYKDLRTDGGTETDMLMGNFFLNMPSDDKVVQVFMQGNTIVVFNLVSLLAVGISGANGTTLSTRIAEMYAIKDTLTDEKYYDDAKALVASFEEIKAKLIRFDTLKEEYNLDDEEMSEEEYSFVTEYATISDLLTTIKLGETTLCDFLKGEWETKDLYPIIAAFTPGQKALVEMGQLETILKYNRPSKPIEELKNALNEVEESLKDENGNLKVFDVYAGVDREIFTGDFAFTNAAERQQALTGETWDWNKAGERSIGMTVGYIVSGAVDFAMTSVAAGIGIKTAVMKSTIASLGVAIEKASSLSAIARLKGLRNIAEKALKDFSAKWGGVGVKMAVSALAFALILAGGYTIATAYNYYNPNYTTIPNTMIDVRTTDLGDEYIKYTAAKVFGDDGKKNADFNAYQGKEWIALYYTKDATAGKCLTPKFVHSDNNSTIARRHQGISMFGETEAFNLNSHVYSKNAPSVYLTMRYSTAKKAAADVPAVVGSMFGGTFYALAALGGAGVGVGAMVAIDALKKKKKSIETNESLD